MINSVLVIDVPNIDAHLKRVEEAGGKLFKPKVKVGDMGWYAQIKDNQGNVLGLWETVKNHPLK